MLPSPALMLGHPKFPTWYPGQDRVFSAFMDWIASDKRFLCASIPTGSGKSVLAALLASASGMRSVTLTATKGLQDQLLSDFYQIGMHDIRGQNSYQCVYVPDSNVDEGPCHAGVFCPHKAGGCFFYDQLSVVKSARSVVTNYSFYLAQTGHSDGLGPVPLLILDEAHLAFRAIEGYLQVYIGRDEVETIGVRMPRRGFDTWAEWKQWAFDSASKAEELEAKLKAETTDAGSRGEQVPSSLIRAVKRVTSTVRKLESVYSALGDWVWEPKYTGFLFTPVWPGRYASRLYRDSAKVLLMSAVLTPKTVQLLGVPEDQMTWLEAPSYFPPENSPVVHVDSVRMDHRTSDMELRQWVSKIDQILDRRTDRKGLLFPVSYERRNFFMAHSRHQRYLYSHTPEDVVFQVNRFRQAPAPATMVSPAVTSGWDFPGDECRYVIVGKIPFADGRSPVVKARTKDDPDFGGYDAMQTIVQEAGRGQRSVDDWCEVLIVDNHWGWFWHKNQDYAPSYFDNRVMRGKMDLVPTPDQVQVEFKRRRRP